MREVLKGVKELQSEKRGWVPNPRGTSLVGRGGGDRSYAAQTVGKSGPSPRHRGHKGALGTENGARGNQAQRMGHSQCGARTCKCYQGQRERLRWGRARRHGQGAQRMDRSVSSTHTRP